MFLLSRIFVRRYLIATAIILFAVLVSQVWDSALSVGSNISDPASRVYDTTINILYTISTAVTGIALPTLTLWAAHNLKPIKFISDGLLLKFITILLIALLVAMTFQFFAALKASIQYFPMLESFVFKAFSESINWFPYTLAEMALLAFAYVQLTGKIRSQPMSSTMRMESKND